MKKFTNVTDMAAWVLDNCEINYLSEVREHQQGRYKEGETARYIYIDIIEEFMNGYMSVDEIYTSDDVYQEFADCASEQGDRMTDIYYGEILKSLHIFREAMDEASDSGLMEGVKGGDVERAIQIGQYHAYSGFYLSVLDGLKDMVEETDEDEGGDFVYEGCKVLQDALNS